MAYDINEWLATESGRIGPDIYKKSLNTSPWLKLVEQETWPDQMGYEVSVLTYSRSLPETALSWGNVGFSTGTGSGSCVPSASVVNFYQKLATYNLQQTAIQSPAICVNDLRYSWRAKDQLSHVFRILTENTSYAWKNRYRDEYVRIANHKMVVTSALPENSAAFPTTIPTSKLVQPVLDKVRMSLIRDGAGNDPLGRENGTPVFGLICSSETSYDLIRSISTDREDYRYSTKANDLLAPLGVERTYKGYYHIIDDFMPRYNFVSGAWVEVQPYVKQTVGGVTEWVVNPAYEGAHFEVSIVFHKDVFKSVIPAPITNPGGNTKFDAVSYRGDFKWLNIRDRNENPDGTIGYFRGVLSSGSKPVRPEWGYAIMHARCPGKAADLGLVACS
jgi:hypothetical protein